MKKGQFIQEMMSRGWVLDRWGHLHKDYSTETEQRKLRLKVQKTSVRLERQVVYEATQYTKKEKGWIRLDSEYFSNISKLDDNSIKIGKYKFKGSK